ncbi:MAG: hypothetical protein MHPSP_004584, partial [Paramarteilia canceri]
MAASIIFLVSPIILIIVEDEIKFCNLKDQTIDEDSTNHCFFDSKDFDTENDENSFNFID